ncbi:MAG: type secretion target repeat protein [Planctomycetota bacterium]|nr:type secretion target repeat protein [Planctomycetota bacterium]
MRQILKTWLGTPSRRRRGNASQFTVEALESRDLKTVVITNVGGKITIDATTETFTLPNKHTGDYITVSSSRTAGSHEVDIDYSRRDGTGSTQHYVYNGATPISLITFLGSSGDDTFDATFSASPVSAWGNDGNDELDGGIGNDTLFGGNGSDKVRGFIGNDTLFGSDANGGGPATDHDTLFGGEGSDTVSGGAGNDEIYGDETTSTGKDGNDFLNGNGGNDTLHGGDGLDVLDGGAGDDFLDGGDDFNSDVLFGGSGADTFKLNLAYLGNGFFVIDHIIDMQGNDKTVL